MEWRMASRTLRLESRPLVMGILNATPDSFSDGGLYLDPDRALDRALAMAGQGASLIDVGGESTRPGARAVPLGEERARVLPVLDRLAGRIPVPLSVDTRKPELAREALQRGAEVINDVGAVRLDRAMLEAVAESGAGYVCLHMQGEPSTMQERPAYRDVAGEVGEFFGRALERCRQAGVAPEQVVLDVGIGFGKTLEHNLALMRAMKSFTIHSRPLLVGVSRKSFLGRISGIDSRSEGLAGSLACACWGWQAGARVFRVHDVGATVRALEAWRAIEGCDDLEPG